MRRIPRVVSERREEGKERPKSSKCAAVDGRRVYKKARVSAEASMTVRHDGVSLRELIAEVRTTLASRRESYVTTEAARRRAAKLYL